MNDAIINKILKIILVGLGFCSIKSKLISDNCKTKISLFYVLLIYGLAITKLSLHIGVTLNVDDVNNVDLWYNIEKRNKYKRFGLII